MDWHPKISPLKDCLFQCRRELQNENSVLGRLSQRVSGVWRDFLRVIRLCHSVYKQRQASWQRFLPGKELDLFCCWDPFSYKGFSGIRLGNAVKSTVLVLNNWDARLCWLWGGHGGNLPCLSGCELQHLLRFVWVGLSWGLVTTDSLHSTSMSLWASSCE